MQSMDLVLLSAAGTGAGTGKSWPGGHTTLVASAGSWGGGSIKLQVQVYGTSTWADVTSATLSADGIVSVFLPPGLYRAFVTTATGTHAKLVRIPY